MQPMAITYIGQHGLPMGRQHRPLVAWYGDLDFMPHIRAFIERGAVDALVTYGDPVPADRDTDRKAMSKRMEGTVRELLVTALRGRPMRHGVRVLAVFFVGSRRSGLKFVVKSNIWSRGTNPAVTG